jgi:hypothetical protein
MNAHPKGRDVLLYIVIAVEIVASLALMARGRSVGIDPRWTVPAVFALGFVVLSVHSQRRITVASALVVVATAALLSWLTTFSA